MNGKYNKTYKLVKTIASKREEESSQISNPLVNKGNNMKQKSIEQNNSSKKVSITELYPSLVHLIVHDETITWSRFSNFLWFNSILILSWATIYSSKKITILDSGFALIVLVTICILGIISGIFWSGIGKRGRDYLNAHVDLASKIEKDSTLWDKEIQLYRPLTEAKKIRDEHPNKYGSALFILTYGPQVFIVFHLILMFVALLRP